MKKITLYFFLLLFLLSACQSEPQKLRLATTTSTQDSGLLDAILPAFEAKYNVTVEVVAVGTGQAIELGQAGNADVLLVHDRPKEDAFVAAGYGLNRQDVMYNDFVIVGPAADPAGVAGSTDVLTVFQKIAQAQAPFISRGDSSGTYSREKSLWEKAGIVPDGAWYQSIGQGMGETLNMANEQQAYTLSDRATWLERESEGIDLTILFQNDSQLFNPYGVIAVNPDLHEGIEADLANDFITWITSTETQNAINAYQINGQQLFFANAKP